jgi:hypothetical protein
VSESIIRRQVNRARFVYELKAKGLPRLKPWWLEMRFVKPSEIRDMNLGRGHKDILHEAGLV